MAERRTSKSLVRTVWVKCTGQKPDCRASREELGVEKGKTTRVGNTLQELADQNNFPFYILGGLQGR